MSLSPPPPPAGTPEPLPPHTRPTSPMRRFSIGEILAWLIILGAVAFIAIRAAQSQSAQANSDQPNMMLQPQAQGLLGFHLITSSLAPAQRAQTDDQALAQLDQSARAPADQLRVAILAGELRGDAEALRRLDAIADPPPDVAADIATARAVYTHNPNAGELPPAFRARYKWFADLLATHGKPDSDPLRSAALARSYFVLTVNISGDILALLATLLGLVLLILGIVFLAQRKLRLAFTRDDPPGHRLDRRAYIYSMATYLGVNLLLLLAFLLIFRLFQLKGDTLGMAASITSLGIGFLLAMALPLLRGQSLAQWRQTFGLHTGRGILREMGAGIVGYLAGLPLVALGVMLFLVLSKITGFSGSHPIEQELGGSSLQLAATFLLACVFAPITEELMFRGALFAHLRERFPWWFSALTMGILFALLHPQSWVALPVLASIGITFGAIREWRGSIIGSMTAHALHNGASLLVAVLVLR